MNGRRGVGGDVQPGRDALAWLAPVPLSLTPALLDRWPLRARWPRPWRPGGLALLLAAMFSTFAALPALAQPSAASAPPAAVPVAAALPPPARGPAIAELEAQIDAIVRRADDRPELALSQLDALEASWSAATAAAAGASVPGSMASGPGAALPAPQTLGMRRELAMARAELAARGRDAALAAAQRAQMRTLSRTLDGSLAAADDFYLQALRADRDESAGGAEAARSALLAYETYCKSIAAGTVASGAASGAGSGSTAGAGTGAGGIGGNGSNAAASAPDGATAAAAATTGPASSAAPASCEFRRRWRLQQLQSMLARRQHAWSAARASARGALVQAQSVGDSWRQAWSETELAMVAHAEHDAVRAEQYLQRAQQLAARHGDAVMTTRLLFTEASLAVGQGDEVQARRALQQALLTAREAQSPRLQALALNNLSDRALYVGRPADALDAALQGLALVLPLQLPHIERVLRNNAMLARVALGRQAEARQDFEALQAAWGADGATGLQLSSLREYGDALANAGELKGALEMHHRERTLSEQLMAANRDAALAELRTRYDREAQQRNILQLERDNALKSAELDNQGLQRKLWALGGGVMALAVALLFLLVRRVRATNRLLESSRALLRVQSQRDALTGLANRRHAQAVLQAMARPGEGAPAFAGALLMIDIDHFKRINDEHGHAAGDAVLVEVARRIGGAVRGQDTVARWGGEEFLVLAPNQHSHDTDALAQRVLQAVAGTPVRLLDGSPLRVTASIGHAVFPLPPHQVSLSPEQALNLVDMALYTAKSLGRNRAVGIVQADAADAESLRKLESDFERAWREAGVILRIDPGP